VERVLEFRGRTNLVFEGNGSAFRSYNAMTSGSYAADQRAMWRVIASTGIVLDNMSLTGAYAHGGTLDSSLQHAHGVDVRGSSVEISHVKVGNVAGDCFYLGLGYDNATRSSGSVHDSSCSSAGRNGIAFTAANKVTVSTNSFGILAIRPSTSSPTSASPPRRPDGVRPTSACPATRSGITGSTPSR
jgi:hypothetical protein